MKARNPLYRPLLRAFLWMGGLEGKAQIGLVLGLFVGSRVLRGLARARPELAPFIFPVLGIYAGFVLLTWIAEPLFNLLLRLDRFGRHALSREQIVASNWLGADLAVGLAALLVGARRPPSWSRSPRRAWLSRRPPRSVSPEVGRAGSWAATRSCSAWC
jgi:hypothetical protein